jgi:hypothetical protein
MTIDGCENLNTKGRTLLSCIGRDAEGNLSPMLYNLGVSEALKDVDFLLNKGLVLFYGAAVSRLGLVRKDRGNALIQKSAELIQSFCNDNRSPYTTSSMDCYYHAVLQSNFKSYSGKESKNGSTTDHGIGKITIAWIKLIVTKGTPINESRCILELKAWIRAQKQNPHRASLVEWSNSVLSGIATLGNAHIPAGVPTMELYGTLNESDNHVHKKAAGGVKAPSLQHQGALMRTVETTRGYRYVRSSVVTVVWKQYVLGAVESYLFPPFSSGLQLLLYEIQCLQSRIMYLRFKQIPLYVIAPSCFSLYVHRALCNVVSILSIPVLVNPALCNLVAFWYPALSYLVAFWYPALS